MLKPIPDTPTLDRIRTKHAEITVLKDFITWLTQDRCCQIVSETRQAGSNSLEMRDVLDHKRAQRLVLEYLEVSIEGVADDLERLRRWIEP